MSAYVSHPNNDSLSGTINEYTFTGSGDDEEDENESGVEDMEEGEEDEAGDSGEEDGEEGEEEEMDIEPMLEVCGTDMILSRYTL